LLVVYCSLAPIARVERQFDNILWRAERLWRRWFPQ
jgi:hypothetical protein